MIVVNSPLEQQGDEINPAIVWRLRICAGARIFDETTAEMGSMGRTKIENGPENNIAAICIAEGWEYWHD